MTKLFPLILSLCFALNSCKHEANNNNTINAVIGDVSYTQKYGRKPGNSVNENERIQTHLAYVEHLLRKKDMSHLSKTLQKQRLHTIALLHEYRVAGSFPKNYDHRGVRRPCFIDKDGNICAVGYLIAQTAGRPLAEKINAEHKYDLIRDMQTPELGEWVAASGLSAEECAMIQPSYGWREQPEVPLGYSISTAAFTGANAVFTGVNIRQSIAGRKSSTVALFGLASGITQTTLGILNLENNDPVSDKHLAASKINIGLGVATIASSMVNLVLNKQPRIKNTNVTLSSFNTVTNGQALGFTLTRKL